GVSDLHDHGRRQLDVERDAVVHGDVDLDVLQQEVLVLADYRAGNGDLVVVLHVHEDEVVAILVQVGVIAAVHRGGFDLQAGVERLVLDLAADDILDLGAHEGAALARLHVLELNDVPQLAVQFQHGAVLDVVGCGHSFTFVDDGGPPAEGPPGPERSPADILPAGGLPARSAALRMGRPRLGRRRLRRSVTPGVVADRRPVASHV